MPTRVSNIDGVLSRLDTTRATDAFVFARSTETEGSDIYYLPAIGGQARRLTNLATKWQGLREPTEISFKSFDGLYMQGFLYLPPNIEGQRCPALVQVHGGGSNWYMRSQNLMEQYLASKGFVVLAINYRGGSGFGREFQDLAVNDWLNGQAMDPGAAADYLRTLSYVNGKVGIYGGSYGGMQSMAAITRTPRKFDAARAYAGHLLAGADHRSHGPSRKDLREDRPRRDAQGAAGDLCEEQHHRPVLSDRDSAS